MRHARQPSQGGQARNLVVFKVKQRQIRQTGAGTDVSDLIVAEKKMGQTVQFGQGADVHDLVVLRIHEGQICCILKTCEVSDTERHRVERAQAEHIRRRGVNDSQPGHNSSLEICIFKHDLTVSSRWTHQGQYGSKHGPAGTGSRPG